MARRDVFLDTESFWSEDVSIRHMCMKKYMDRSFTYLWSLVSDDFEWVGTPDEFRQNAKAQEIVTDPNTNPWAVNSNFDFSWFNKDFPEVGRRMRGWQCVSDYAVYHQRPRALANMYQALTGKTHSKSMRNAMKDRHFFEFLQFEQDNVKQMNLDDGRVAKESLSELRKLGPMAQSERELAAHTRMICRRGINMDPEYIEQCRIRLEWARHNAKKEIPWADRETVMDVGAFNTYSCSMGIAPPGNLRKDGADFTEWMEANPKMAPVMKARQRFELANRKLSHIESFLERCHEGIYYPDLLYCGAPHTRRFSAKGSSDGAQTDSDVHSGFNVQNMDKAPIFGDIFPDAFAPLPLKTKAGVPLPGIFFRNFLVPRAGKKFVILDFAQIEPRCLFWLAGCEELLQKIREGFSIYEAFARSVGMWNEVGKLKETASVAYYTKVKNAAIGSGYGMGGPKFANYAKIPLEEATETIFQIRENNPRVPAFWRQLQGLCREASRSKEPLEIAMPNGETFRYFNVTQYNRPNKEGGFSFAYRADKVLGDPNRNNTKDIYGGRLTENVTQRMARDLMGEAILRIEKAGMSVAFHAHDEIILEVDREDADSALVEARRLMEVVPEWAHGLPIEVEGGVYDRYCKA